MNTPKIQVHNGNNVISARELHESLEIGADFTNWCKRMFEYGFVENTDYIILAKNGENKISKSNPIDYALTLNTAKEIAMIQRSEIGKKIRQYFIDCEKQLNESAQLPANKDQIIQQAMLILSERLNSQQAQLESANNTIIKQAPKVQYVNEVLQSTNTHTTTTIAKELGMSAIQLNKLMKEKGIQYVHQGHWVLTAKYHDKGYTKTKTHTYLDSESKTKTEIQTVWTELGRAFIHKQFNTNLLPSTTLSSFQNN